MVEPAMRMGDRDLFVFNRVTKMGLAGLPGVGSLFQSKDEPEVSEGQANWGRSFRVLNLSQISSRGRGGGNVGIGFIDFQGLWKGRKTALSFSGLSIDRHFLRPLASMR
jgi:hypothetical protein